MPELDDVPEGWFRGPLPAPFDQTVAKVVDSYIEGDERRRGQVLAGLDTDRAWTLSGYAERAASLAVHERSPELLVRGLVAIGLAATQLYHKELLILLPLFWHSAARISVDGGLLFTSAADLVGADAPSWIRAYPERDERGRSLAVMGYEEHEEPNGLLCRRTF